MLISCAFPHVVPLEMGQLEATLLQGQTLFSSQFSSPSPRGSRSDENSSPTIHSSGSMTASVAIHIPISDPDFQLPSSTLLLFFFSTLSMSVRLSVDSTKFASSRLSMYSSFFPSHYIRSSPSRYERQTRLNESFSVLKCWTKSGRIFHPRPEELDKSTLRLRREGHTHILFWSVSE